MPTPNGYLLHFVLIELLNCHLLFDRIRFNTTGAGTPVNQNCTYISISHILLISRNHFSLFTVTVLGKSVVISDEIFTLFPS